MPGPAAAAAASGGAAEAGAAGRAASASEGGGMSSGGSSISDVFGGKGVPPNFGTQRTQVGGGGGGKKKTKKGKGGGKDRDPETAHTNSQAEQATRMWEASWVIDNFIRIKDYADSSLPTYAESVVVNVYGTPRSNFSSLYYLAMSAAWGAISPVPTFGAPCTVRTWTDRTAMHVWVQISYSVKGSWSNAALKTPANRILEGPNSNLNASKILFAPGDSVKGRPWPEKLGITLGFVNLLGLTAGDQNVLEAIKRAKLTEFDGKYITTTTDDIKALQGSSADTYRSLDPVPNFDGVSRETDLTAIITQALWEPELEQPPDPKTNFRYKVTKQPAFNAIQGGVTLVPGQVELPPEVKATLEEDKSYSTFGNNVPDGPPPKTQ